MIRAVGNISKLALCLFGFFLNINTVDADRTARGLDNSGDCFDRCGFTRAVVTDKSGDRAVLSRERDIVDNRFFTILFGIVLYTDQADRLLSFFDNL